MRKKDVILIGIVGVLAIVVLSSLIFIGNQQTKQLPLPVQIYSPSPTPTSQFQISIPTQLQDEYIKQENYAKERQAFVNEKPWVRQLPLKSGNFFVSYDPEDDSLLVSLYYSISSNEPKNSQLERAKESALKTIKNAGIDPNKQKIQYIETSLK